MLGDSFTQGYPGVNGFRNGAASAGNPTGSWHFTGLSNSGDPPVNRHRGVNGWKTTNHLAEIGIYGLGLNQFRPTVFSVLIGINDCITAPDFADLPTNYALLINDLHTRVPSARFVVMNLFHYNSNATIESRRVSFNADLPAIWNDFEASGIKLVRLDIDILSEAAGDYTTTPDTNHPSAQGYAKLAAVIGPAIASALAL